MTPIRQNASLSSTQRTLYVLWEEYFRGLNGAKAAKNFTAAQRGAVKHKYCLRKVFLDCVTRLVNSGLSVDIAIDQIYTTYGRRNAVTKILWETSKDRRSGRIPHLIRTEINFIASFFFLKFLFFAIVAMVTFVLNMVFIATNIYV